MCYSGAIFSQALSTPPPAAAGAYAAEPIVIRDSRIVVDMKADGTGVRSESLSVTVQSEASLRTFGVVGIAFASASERAEFVYVRVRRPDHSVIDTPLEGVQEQAAEATREAPFYSDIKQKQLPVKGLRVGDTLEWQSRVTVFKPEAPG